MIEQVHKDEIKENQRHRRHILLVCVTRMCTSGRGASHPVFPPVSATPLRNDVEPGIKAEKTLALLMIRTKTGSRSRGGPRNRSPGTSCSSQPAHVRYVSTHASRLPSRARYIRIGSGSRLCMGVVGQWRRAVGQHACAGLSEYSGGGARRSGRIGMCLGTVGGVC
jgi:hypothetical protein